MTARLSKEDFEKVVNECLQVPETTQALKSPPKSAEKAVAEEAAKPALKGTTEPAPEDAAKPAPGEAAKPKEPPRPIGAESSARSVKWSKLQDRHGIPSAAKLNSDVKDSVRIEESTRNFERIIDGEQDTLDPRFSFRKDAPVRAENTTISASEALANWKKLLASDIDPRKSFRQVVSVLPGVKASGPTTATKQASATESKTIPEPTPSTKPASTTESKTAPEPSTPSGPKDDLPEPTLSPRPKTWLENIPADYPGGLQYDLRMIGWVILACLILPLITLFVLLTAFVIYQLVQPACEYRGVSTLSAMGPALHLPDFCVMSNLSGTQSSSPVVKDPLGVIQTLKWPLTVPDLKHLDAEISHHSLSFTSINAELQISLAANMEEPNVYIESLSRSSAQRLQANKALQGSFTTLTSRYDILISDLLQWSIRAPKEMHAIAQPSTGLGKSILLLWGPLIRLKTPLGEIKDALRVPVQELLGDAGRLADQTNTAIHALQVAKQTREKFRMALAEGKEHFIERCGLPKKGSWSARGSGGASVKDIPFCKSWDPVAMKNSMGAVGKEEDVLFESVEKYLDLIAGSVWPLGKFYNGVLRELGDVTARKYGDVWFDTLDSLRAFARNFGERMGAAGRVLEVKMGK